MPTSPYETLALANSGYDPATKKRYTAHAITQAYRKLVLTQPPPDELTKIQTAYFSLSRSKSRTYYDAKTLPKPVFSLGETDHHLIVYLEESHGTDLTHLIFSSGCTPEKLHAEASLYPTFARMLISNAVLFSGFSLLQQMQLLKWSASGALPDQREALCASPQVAALLTRAANPEDYDAQIAFYQACYLAWNDNEEGIQFMVSAIGERQLPLFLLGLLSTCYAPMLALLLEQHAANLILDQWVDLAIFNRRTQSALAEIKAYVPAALLDKFNAYSRAVDNKIEHRDAADMKAIKAEIEILGLFALHRAHPKNKLGVFHILFNMPGFKDIAARCNSKEMQELMFNAFLLLNHEANTIPQAELANFIATLALEADLDGPMLQCLNHKAVLLDFLQNTAHLAYLSQAEANIIAMLAFKNGIQPHELPATLPEDILTPLYALLANADTLIEQRVVNEPSPSSSHQPCIEPTAIQKGQMENLETVLIALRTRQVPYQNEVADKGNAVAKLQPLPEPSAVIAASQQITLEPVSTPQAAFESISVTSTCHFPVRLPVSLQSLKSHFEKFAPMSFESRMSSLLLQGIPWNTPENMNMVDVENTLSFTFRLFNTPDFGIVKEKVFGALKKEMDRLKTEGGHDKALQLEAAYNELADEYANTIKTAYLTNKKIPWDTLAHIVYPTLKNKIAEIAHRPFIHVQRNRISAILKGILGTLLAMPMFFIPFAFQGYRDTFFNTRTCGRLHTIHHKLEAAERWVKLN